MLRKLTGVLLIIATVFVIGCAAHTHKIGHGAVLNWMAVVEQQWYILYGLVPINDVDTQAMVVIKGIMKSPPRLHRSMPYIR